VASYPQPKKSPVLYTNQTKTYLHNYLVFFFFSGDSKGGKKKNKKQKTKKQKYKPHSFFSYVYFLLEGG